ncbi:MAG: dienelactone hydrolase family protein [Planctomycetes bacterium]|nr:dienelactone hydrolase family protein [Planctomycetota bacterium]
MVFWFWILITVLAVPPIAYGLGMAALYLYVRWNYMGYLTRIFQEKPLFVIPRGEKPLDGEEVAIKTDDGLTLRGCYLKTAAPDRKGVILFGLEFGSNRWACRPYCEKLLEVGYDVFAVESRSQGESDKDPNYEPLQWVTDRDLADTRTTIKYLLSRPDADPRGIGIFGISKGGGTGFLAASNEPRVRCMVTDGAYGTHTTMIPYLKRWIQIYSDRKILQRVLPTWFYGIIGMVGAKKVARNRGVTYPSIEKAVGRLNRPLLMIHGEGDNYIRPEMAQALFARARGQKELWVVPKAKHNGALTVAGDAYHARVVAFFDAHLANNNPPSSSNPPAVS